MCSVDQSGREKKKTQPTNLDKKIDSSNCLQSTLMLRLERLCQDHLALQSTTILNANRILTSNRAKTIRFVWLKKGSKRVASGSKIRARPYHQAFQTGFNIQRFKHLMNVSMDISADNIMQAVPILKVTAHLPRSQAAGLPISEYSVSISHSPSTARPFMPFGKIEKVWSKFANTQIHLCHFGLSLFSK